MIYGQEYHRLQFVTVGFQDDDLPLFGQITDILVLVGTPLVSVKLYTTLGINNHLSCFAIACTYQYSIFPVSKLVSLEPLTAHKSIGDENIYIAMRLHVINTQ